MAAQENERIELAHGGGGLVMHQLIEQVFRPAFAASPSDLTHDGAVFDLGDVELGVHNRLLCRPPTILSRRRHRRTRGQWHRQRPRDVRRTAPLSQCWACSGGGFAAHAAPSRRSVACKKPPQTPEDRLVTGDTKVVEHGKGDGLDITTAGIGLVRANVAPAPHNVRPGDAVLLSGDIGRHGIAVMAAREGFRI